MSLVSRADHKIDNRGSDDAQLAGQVEEMILKFIREL